MVEVLSLIKYPLIIALITLAMNYLNRQSKKGPATDSQGNILLRLPAFYGVLGIGSALLGFGLLLLGLIDYKQDAIKTILLLFLLFGGLGVPLILYRYVYKVTLTPQSLVHRNLIGKYKSVRWDDIKSVKYNAATMALKLSDGSSKITCYAHLIGFDLLVDELANRTGRSRDEMKIPTF